MMSYGLSVEERLLALGQRARARRLSQGLGQDELAARAGVGTATVQRFEKAGSASIENVLRIAVALDAERAFDELFAPAPFASIDEALSLDHEPQRRRAPRRKR